MNFGQPRKAFGRARRCSRTGTRQKSASAGRHPSLRDAQDSKPRGSRPARWVPVLRQSTPDPGSLDSQLLGCPTAGAPQQWSAFLNGKKVPRYRASSYRECMVEVTGPPPPFASAFWQRMLSLAGASHPTSNKAPSPSHPVLWRPCPRTRAEAPDRRKPSRGRSDKVRPVRQHSRPLPHN